jgi:Putative capsular polysaccharide synthesis protein
VSIISAFQSEKLIILKNFTTKMMHMAMTLVIENLKKILFEIKTYARIKRKLYKSECILVHQMGKVGSSTIIQSLEKSSYDSPVFHTHILNPIQLKSKIDRYLSIRSEKGIKKVTWVMGHLATSKVLSPIIQKESGRRAWKIITLVREPVGRNISAFFQNIDAYFDDFIESYNRGTLNNKEISEKFFNEFKHNIPLEWLDLEIKDVFGIDLYQHEFPKTKGYSIQSSEDGIDCMVIRIEDLNRCHKDAFRDFLGIQDFTLVKENIGDTKDYSDIYKSFLKEITFPDWYLERMYSSKYAKHFYSDVEIQKLCKRWGENKLEVTEN